MPPFSPMPLPGLQWVPGVNAVEVQQASQLSINAQDLSYSHSTDITIAEADMWKAINGLLGLNNDPANNRYYLGAPHPLYTERIVTYDPINQITIVERIPMLWVDSLTVTPMDDHYWGVNGEVFPGDGGNPQLVHFRTCRLRVNYSNDPIHYSRLKCSWQPKLEQEYVQVGQLLWKDESKSGNAQYDDSPEFMALPTQKYARRSMTADIQYSVHFFMNPTSPGCLPEWCDTAFPIPDNASPAMVQAEERKLLGSINRQGNDERRWKTLDIAYKCE